MLGGVDKQDIIGLLALLQDKDADRDAGRVEQVRWQPNDGVDVPTGKKLVADFRLCALSEQCAVRHNDCHHAIVLIAGIDWFVSENAIVVGRVRLENNASVWYHAVLRGDNDLITVGDNSLIGINSVVLNGAKIGRDCLIGARKQPDHRGQTDSGRFARTRLAGACSTPSDRRRKDHAARKRRNLCVQFQAL